MINDNVSNLFLYAKIAMRDVLKIAMSINKTDQTSFTIDHLDDRAQGVSK